MSRCPSCRILPFCPDAHWPNTTPLALSSRQASPIWSRPISMHVRLGGRTLKPRQEADTRIPAFCFAVSPNFTTEDIENFAEHGEHSYHLSVNRRANIKSNLGDERGAHPTSKARMRPLDISLIQFVEALAIADARRDHLALSDPIELAICGDDGDGNSAAKFQFNFSSTPSVNSAATAEVAKADAQHSYPSLAPWLAATSAPSRRILARRT